MPLYNVSVKNFTYHGMPGTVPANRPFQVSFRNEESFQITHEFVVLRLPAGKTAQDVIKDAKKKGPKGEDDWVHVGDSGDVDTGGGVLMTLDLPPGNYVATCWQTGKSGGGTGPPHVTIGMAQAFTASASASAPAVPAGPTYNVSVKNFTYHGMPSTVPANQPFQVAFTNDESFAMDHEFVVLQLPAGKTAQDVIQDAKKKGPDAEDDWIHFADSGDPLPVGAGHLVSMDLPPGNYVATCWQTGKAGGGTGPPHVTIGMIASFTASASASAPPAQAAKTYDVSVKNFTYHGMPASVPANQLIQVAFTNDESFAMDHEFVVLRLPAGKTAQDVIKDAKKKGPDAEDDWIHVGDSGDPLPVGGTTVISMDLPPGNYVATCWQTGKAGGGTGPPHVTIGMITPFAAS
ncbi:MAG TPA: hypothetical protein VFV41_09460 [Streptosporangiaceae bacterium]|nr:hypothetical protein [Streptosporangiaceae bacterium]